MNRCSPVEMRKNLKLVETFKQYGIDFVPVPVFTNDQKFDLVELVAKRMIDLEQMVSVKASD